MDGFWDDKMRTDTDRTTLTQFMKERRKFYGKNKLTGRRSFMPSRPLLVIQNDRKKKMRPVQGRLTNEAVRKMLPLNLTTAGH